MFLFYELNHRLSRYMSRDKVDVVARAFLVAANAHEDQFRSSGEPYITHPVAVSCILSDMYMDAETISAALLHDVIEDTDTTQAELATQFGDKVAELVEGVTKLAKIQFESKAEAQAESFRKMMLAMVEDIRVILIKLADRLHNMRTLGALRPDKRRRIARETMEVFAPIANRLGMNSFKNAFEDLGFQAMYPVRYRVLAECVRQARGNRRRLMEKIFSTLAIKLSKEGISADNVLGREKRLASIFYKMRHKGLPFSDIMDVYGFRVVTPNIGECYRILGVVHSIFTPVPGRFKDYIAIPKANGYQSLHTTLFGPYGVPIEIQIRTIEMDNVAENGIAAHWIYKNDGYASETEERTRQWLQSVLDLQLRSGSSFEFIENMKIDLFPDEVYIFTPQGDIKELPRGATPVDFAYSVHTEVGDKTVAVKINRRLAPLSQTLMNGQTIEIITESNAKPNPAWLNFVVTGKAKGAIKHFLNSQQEAESVTLGRKLLNYSLGEFGLSWASMDEKYKASLLEALQIKQEKILFAQIGLGEKASAVVTHQLIKIYTPHDQKPVHEESNKVVLGAEGLSTIYAKCCYPIPGDNVRGLMDKGRGIVVHRADCEVFDSVNIEKNPDASIHFGWAVEVKQLFPVEVKIECENATGAIARISRVLSSEGVDIDDFRVLERGKQYAIIIMILKVSGRKALASVMRKLRSLDIMMKVERTVSKKNASRRMRKG